MQKNIINLSNLNSGESGYITNISGNLKLKTRLMELGFTKGTLVKILNISSLKQSYLIEIRGYILALRKNVISLVEITPNKESLWNIFCVETQMLVKQPF